MAENVAITALRQRLGFVQGLIQRCNKQLEAPDAPTRNPVRDQSYIKLIKRAG